MPVAAATTPEWMAALLAKKKEKKDDSGLNTKRDAVLSATKATPAWVRNGDTAKSAGKGSPITGRTLLGSPQLRATVAQRNGGLNNFSEASITASDVPKHKAFHSSTLPRSFGGSGAHAAATKNSREAPNNKTTDDTSLKREVDVLLVRSSQQASKAGRVSGNEKSSVARLRDFYTKQPEESEKAASPKLSSRPRATAASASQRQVARTVVATPASSASKLGSTSNTLTTPENNLRRISEERQHSDPFLPSSSLTSAASGRKTSDERQPTSLPKSHGLPASVPDDQSSHRQSRVTSSSSSTLECTNIDDFVAEKGMTIRSFSMSTVDAIQNGQFASVKLVCTSQNPYRAPAVAVRRSRNLENPEHTVFKIMLLIKPGCTSV